MIIVLVTDYTYSDIQVHGFVLDNKTGQKVARLMGKWDEPSIIYLEIQVQSQRGMIQCLRLFFFGNETSL